MDRFYWDDPYPIALELLRRHPDIDPLSVDWETLHRWVIELPQFADDASITGLSRLEDIQKEWYEEAISR
ncbi:MAG TPA: Fe-S cluster assembly protein IscX [Anaerolineae bacterium]